MQCFECQGIWWLPEAAAHRIAGTLRFDPSAGVNLRVMGDFPETATPTGSLHADALPRIPVIHGTTTDGKDFTLLDCLANERTKVSHGIPTLGLYAHHAIEGFHFAPGDLLFHDMSVSYSHLEEWASLIEYEPFERPTKEGGRYHHVLRYSCPEVLSAHLDECVITLSSRFKQHMDMRGYSGEVIPYVDFEPGAPTPLDTLLEWNYHMANFLMLAIGRPVAPRDIILHHANAVRELDSGQTQKVDLSLYFQPVAEVMATERFSYLGVFFLLNDIAGDFERYLRESFGKADLLRPVYDLYFSLVNRLSMFLETRFLTVAQALETYHRRIIGGKYVEDAEWEQVRPCLTEALPPSVHSEFRDSITQRLRYLNEYSLRRRLADLCRECEQLGSFQILEPRAFVNAFVDTRNYLTHFDERLRHEAMRGRDLVRAIERGRSLLEICLLKEIGMDQANISRLVSSNSRFRAIRELAGDSTNS